MDSIVFKEEWNVGDVFKRALISDPHIKPGKPNKALKKALDKCKDENIKILINGDLADFIIPQDKKRYNKAHDLAHTAGVLNEQVEFVVDFLMPYVHLIELIGIGNHEDVLIKYHAFDAIRFILRDLNRIRKEKKLDPIHYGSYRGFISYQFCYSKGNRSKSFCIARHHGGGGNAPVTGGAIDINRFMSGFNADLYWIGHKHKDTMRGVPVVYVNEKGNVCQKMRRGIMTPGFQQPITIEDFNVSGGNCSFEDRFYDTNPIGWGLIEIKPINRDNNVEFDWTVTMIDG